MALLIKKTLFNIEKKELKLLEDEKAVLKEIADAAQELGERRDELIDKIREINVLTPDNLKFIADAASDIISYLNILKEKLGKHFGEEQLIKSITEWGTVLKIVNDEKELAKMPLDKFKATIEEDVREMMNSLMGISAFVDKRKIKVAEAIRNLKEV